MFVLGSYRVGTGLTCKFRLNWKGLPMTNILTFVTIMDKVSPWQVFAFLLMKRTLYKGTRRKLALALQARLEPTLSYLACSSPLVKNKLECWSLISFLIPTYINRAMSKVLHLSWLKNSSQMRRKWKSSLEANTPAYFVLNIRVKEKKKVLYHRHLLVILLTQANSIHLISHNSIYLAFSVPLRPSLFMQISPFHSQIEGCCFKSLRDIFASNAFNNFSSS